MLIELNWFYGLYSYLKLALIFIFDEHVFLNIYAHKWTRTHDDNLFIPLHAKS